MSRRPSRGSRRTTGGLRPLGPDPGAAGGAVVADNAWRAEDQTGSPVASLVPFRGAVTLAAAGVGQSTPAATALLGGRAGVSFLAASRGYTGAITPSTAHTVLSVVYAGGTNKGIYSCTVAGAVNTGSSHLHGTPMITRRSGFTDLNSAGAAPRQVVVCSVYDTANMYSYVTAYTAATNAGVGAAVGSDFRIGELDNAGTLALDGQWGRTYFWNRALTAAEVRTMLTWLGRYYGISIAA